MARLISKATGNFTAAGTWALADATSLLESEISNTALTTAYKTSSTFTPGAITIDGIAVKLATRPAGSPSNTITVALDQAGADVSGTAVTINVADIDQCLSSDTEGGWYLFKFAAPVTLAAATAYAVKAKLSATTTAVNLFRNATADNWSRMLRTTTTQAPAAGDTLVVIGEHTGAGTGNSFTVTMDNTTTTDFGAAVANDHALQVGKRGTLTWGIMASTSYKLRLSGNLAIQSGGTMNMGTTGTPMPSSSSAQLEFNAAAAGDAGLMVFNGGTCVAQGTSIATTKTKLTANAASGATTLQVGSTAGWGNGGGIVLAPTGVVPGDWIGMFITTVDSAVQVTVPALPRAYSGTAPKQAEVIFYSRNVKFAIVTAASFVSIRSRAAVDFDYVEFNGYGVNAVNKQGIHILVGTLGSCSIRFCSIYYAPSYGVVINGAGAIEFSDNVLFRLNYDGTSNAAGVHVVSIGAGFLKNNTIIGVGNDTTPASDLTLAGFALQSSASLCPIDGNTVVGSLKDGFSMGGVTIGSSFDGNTAHTNGLAGLIFTASDYGGTVSNFTAWNNGYGIQSNGLSRGLVIATATIFGNSDTGIYGTGEGHLDGWIMKNLTVDAGITDVQPQGLFIGASSEFVIIDSTFGANQTHSVGDIIINSSAAALVHVYLFNTKLASATELANRTSLSSTGQIQSHKHDQSTAHRTWQRYAIIDSEATIRHTDSGLSWKIAPKNATRKAYFPGPWAFSGMKATVLANVQVTVSAWVRKDSSYNGSSPPRLVLLGGILPGIPADVTASLTVAPNIWEQLSVTATPTEDGVIEFYVDALGTAGAFYVDDVDVVQ